MNFNNINFFGLPFGQQQSPSQENNNQQQQQSQNQQSQNIFTNLFGNGSPFDSFPQIFGQPYFQQQAQSNQQQQPQDSQPSFHNTRSNWKQKKSEQKSNSKKSKNQDSEPKPNTGAYWKKLGNQAFQQCQYDKAIEYYSNAIHCDESQSIYYSNRGRCYKIQNNYKNALNDAYQAIELDEKNIKAHLLCGQCLAFISKFEENYENCIKQLQNAIKKMTKGKQKLYLFIALSLCSGQAGEKVKQYEQELSIYIMRAKKLLWYRSVARLKQKKMDAIKEYINYLQSINCEDKEQKIKDFVETIGDPTKQIDFNIPDNLLCPITLDLIEDPVIIESGLTFEKQMLEDHIKKNGKICPVTRQKISGVYYPNQNVKKGIVEFLDRNPWAFEFKYDEDPMDIKF